MAKLSIPHQLNICLIANKFPILGRAAEHGFLWPIARGMSTNGHKVTVLSWRNPQGKAVIEQDGVTAHYLGVGLNRPGTLNFQQQVFNKFKILHAREPFHLVHSIDAGGFLVGRHRKSLRVAMMYDVESTHMSEMISILGLSQDSLGSMLRTSLKVTYRFLHTYFGFDRKLLNTADGVFVTTPQQRLALERHYLYPDYHTYSVPYGIEIGDLSPREKSDELRKKLGLPANANTVVTFTDMMEFGEMRNLLRAFEKVAIKKPSARMIIVGDGPLKRDIEFEMLNLALGSRVLFAGAVIGQELSDYIALAEVFVNLRSRTSGFEPSMLEAMAQKKVIIGSEVTPISTIVEDGKDGFLVRPADINGIATLLIQIFTDQLPVAHIGESARQKVMSLFDTQKMVQETLDAYYETLSRTGIYQKRSKPLSVSAPSPV